ncbi:MAG: hypothetical protein II948_06270 [Synergistaceae bacterium]|nr:hypothetical protein [Synergistaceae bacterium]
MFCSENFRINENYVDEDSVAEFLNFLEDNENYLDSGLGVFHTDNHSNW